MDLRDVPEASVSLRKKSDELFLRWLSEKETRHFFKDLFKTPLSLLVRGQLSADEPSLSSLAAPVLAAPRTPTDRASTHPRPYGAIAALKWSRWRRGAHAGGR